MAATLAQFIQTHGKRVHQAHQVDYFVGRHPKQLIIQHADQWTFPTLSKHPQRNQFGAHLLWVAMLHKEQLLGIALFNQATPTIAALISFKVHPERRNRKIGTTLLAFSESVCRQWGIQQLLLNYRTYWKSNTYWEKILKQQQWQYHPPNMYYVHVNNTDILYEKMGLHIEAKPIFASINPQTWEQLKSTIAQPDWQNSIPDGLDPLQLANKQLDLQASVLILNNDRTNMIGWVIFHQLSKSIWQVTSLFVKEEYRTSKIGLAAIRESARRHQNRGRVHFMVQPENTKMLAYVKRYMTKWACDLFSQEVAYKEL